jgi:NAD(P)-dependent dehydrogenase (short-subunit alcohol dehydrogenase family)
MAISRFIFITGAASGIGRATATRFAAEGWKVGAADLNDEGLASLKAELGGNQCETYPLDVTDHAMFVGVMAEFGEWSGGQLDLLFNNAGIGAIGQFDDVPISNHMDTINVNLVGVVNGIDAAMSLLKSTDNSLCFSTSSSAAIYGAPGLAVYAATKFAVKGLTEALSVELAAHGSRAADVLPGLIDTPILRAPHYVDGIDVSTGERNIGPADAEEGPFRLIPPSEIANAVFEAYTSDRVHWYVPAELEEMDKMKSQDVEAARDERLAAADERGASRP